VETTEIQTVVPPGCSCRPDQVPRALLTVHARAGDGVVWIELGGELDIATTPTMATILDAVLDASSCSVVVDLREVRFLGVAAIRALDSRARRCADAGLSVSLCNTDEHMRRVLTVYDRHGREPTALRW
jgi:anti-anti-sigma factor